MRTRSLCFYALLFFADFIILGLQCHCAEMAELSESEKGIPHGAAQWLLSPFWISNDRPIDRSLKIASWAIVAGDIVSTDRALDNGCIEAGYFAGGMKSRASMYALRAGGNYGTELLMNYLVKIGAGNKTSLWLTRSIRGVYLGRGGYVVGVNFQIGGPK